MDEREQGDQSGETATATPEPAPKRRRRASAPDSNPRKARRKAEPDGLLDQAAETLADGERAVASVARKAATTTRRASTGPARRWHLHRVRPAVRRVRVRPQRERR